MAIFFNTTNCHQNCFLPDFSVFTNVKSSKQILVTTRRTVAVVQWRTAAATHRGRTAVWLRLTVAAAYCGCDLLRLRRTVAVVQCGCGLLRLRRTVAVLQCGCGLLWLRRTVTVLQCGCSLLWLRRTVAVLQCGCGSLWLRGNPLQPPFMIVADFFKLTCERYSSIHNVHRIFSHLSVAIFQLPVGVQLSVL